MTTPEQRARKTIDQRLNTAGWHIQDYAELNLTAARGIAVCGSPSKSASPTTCCSLRRTGALSRAGAPALRDLAKTQQAGGRSFTPEQRWWLGHRRAHQCQKDSAISAGDANCPTSRVVL